MKKNLCFIIFLVLAAFVLSGCGSLNAVDVTKCEKLETFNVSGCEALETVNVKGSKTLKTLGVTGCKALKELDVSDCPNLEELNCGECGIENLTAEQCLSLESMDIHGNSLTYFDAYETTFPKLLHLACGGQTRGGLEAVHSGGAYTLNLSSYVGEAEESGAAAIASLSGIDAASVKGIDADGNPMTPTYDASAGTAGFTSEPKEVKYDYNTGHGDDKMDVALTVGNVEEKTGGNSPSSGCDGGFGLLALAVVPMIMKRRS